MERGDHDDRSAHGPGDAVARDFDEWAGANPRTAAAGAMSHVAQGIAAGFDVKAAFHLDHGDAVAQAAECIAAGYTSVMLDFSKRPFDENAGALREVVALARPRGVTVEGEIGHGQGGSGYRRRHRRSFAHRPRGGGGVREGDRRGRFGGVHRQCPRAYTRLPRFDFDRLEAIRKAVWIPLVLHGGSGTPDEDLKRAITLGIAKINVATDLVTVVRESLRRQWDEKRNLWTPQALAEAMTALADVVRRWIRRTGAEGKT